MTTSEGRISADRRRAARILRCSMFNVIVKMEPRRLLESDE
jgi:hypothetical protein